MSRECSNSLVIDSMVLAGLGNDDVDTKISLFAGYNNKVLYSKIIKLAIQIYFKKCSTHN